MDEKSTPPNSAKNQALHITVEFKPLGPDNGHYEGFVRHAISDACLMVGAKVTFMSTSAT